MRSRLAVPDASSLLRSLTHRAEGGAQAQGGEGRQGEGRQARQGGQGEARQEAKGRESPHPCCRDWPGLAQQGLSARERCAISNIQSVSPVECVLVVVRVPVITRVCNGHNRVSSKRNQPDPRQDKFSRPTDCKDVIWVWYRSGRELTAGQ